MPGPFHRHADLPQTHKAPVHCSTCEAVCCRLKVVLEPGDTIPSHLTTYLPEGPRVMAHDEAGWCVAMDRTHMNCGIYENRPNSCRLFPIEQRDIREVRGTCSYYFIEKPARLGRTG